MRPALILCVVALGGCGADRVVPADPVAVRDPRNFARATEPRTGLSVRVPTNWHRDFRASPGLFLVSSGAAQVSGWAYDRAEPLPEDAAALAAAQDALVAEAKRRNPTLSVEAVRRRDVAGAPGIEIVGAQTIEGNRIRTRSVHFFHDGREFVIEALGPAGAFEKADRGVLTPLLRSLRFA